MAQRVDGRFFAGDQARSLGSRLHSHRRDDPSQCATAPPSRRAFPRAIVSSWDPPSQVDHLRIVHGTHRNSNGLFGPKTADSALPGTATPRGCQLSRSCSRLSRRTRAAHRVATDPRPSPASQELPPAPRCSRSTTIAYGCPAEFLGRTRGGHPAHAHKPVVYHGAFAPRGRCHRGPGSLRTRRTGRRRRRAARRARPPARSTAGCVRAANVFPVGCSPPPRVRVGHSACPDCGGRLRLLATIEDRATVAKILTHLAIRSGDLLDADNDAIATCATDNLPDSLCVLE